MAIINNQGVFIAPPLGEGEGTKITSFRDDDDFSVDIFNESINLPSFPNNIGIAFVRSSESPSDYATISLRGVDTSSVFIENTQSRADLVISGDAYVGYKIGTEITPIVANSPNLIPIGDLFVNRNARISNDLTVDGFIYGNFSDVRLQGTTRFGSNTIEISESTNSITGVNAIAASSGIITSISGISSISGNQLSISGINSITGSNLSISGIDKITPTSNLTIGGSLNITGVSTVGVASTSSLSVNSTLTFELISNTSLRVRVRGTDGIIRSANLTLS